MWDNPINYFKGLIEWYFPTLNVGIGIFIYYFILRPYTDADYANFVDLFKFSFVWTLALYPIRIARITNSDKMFTTESLAAYGVFAFVIGRTIYEFWESFSFIMWLMFSLYLIFMVCSALLPLMDCIGFLIGHQYLLSLIYAYEIENSWEHDPYLFGAPMFSICLSYLMVVGLSQMQFYKAENMCNFQMILGRNDSILFYMAFILAAYGFNGIEGLFIAWSLFSPWLTFFFAVVLSYFLMNNDDLTAEKGTLIFWIFYGVIYYGTHILRTKELISF